MSDLLVYTGTQLEDGDKELGIDPYISSPGLRQAVNLTLFLKKRPLLLMGEPGVGKTRLAESVAYELLDKGAGMKDYFFKWNIKSTTKAKDGLYRYDTFKRLSDSQIFRTEEDRKQLNNLKLGEKDSYIQRGVFSEAFAKSTTTRRSVILIDEIDKADIDFPNDLLNEIENYEFTIPETGEEVKKPENFDYPVIIITSNRERELPPAFLRRCLYYYIDFPDDKMLATIIFKTFNKPAENALVKKALKVFGEIRSNIPETEKKPSTSEMLDWFSVLNKYQTLKEDNTKILELPEGDRKMVQEMIQNLDLLDKTKIPFSEVLLKTYETFTTNQNAG